MTPKKSFDRSPNALHCYDCGNSDISKLRIANDVTKRRRRKRFDDKSKVYDSVAIDCLACGHQWYSTHPEAITRSRKSDKNLKKRHGGND